MKKTTALDRIPKVPPPPKVEVRTAVRMPGTMLTARLIKPVTRCALIISLCSLAWADTQTITAPQGNQPATFPFGTGGGGGLGITVTNPGADATQSINQATAQGAHTINLPAAVYTLTGPIKVTSGQVLQGEGCAFDGVTWFGTVLKMTGSVGYCAIQSATPPTCQTSGVGPCDATLATGGRGKGCVCYGHPDCQSGVCGGGASVRGLVVRNLCIQIQVDKSCGIDLVGVNESDVYDGFIFADATGATDVTGIRASDASGLLSGYSNSIHNWRMGGTGGAKTMKIGVRVMPQANNTTIREVRVLGNVATPIQTDPDPGNGAPLNTHILQNAVETFSSEGILDQAKGTTIEGNYCESGLALGLPCLHLNNGTSVQIRYNFFTPGGLTQPVLFSGSVTTPTQWGSESNLVDTSKFSNVFGNFDWQDFNFQPRGAGPVTCAANQTGRVYYSNVQNTLCACNTWNGTLKWCPIQCVVSTAACPAGFTCGAGQTASTCG